MLRKILVNTRCSIAAFIDTVEVCGSSPHGPTIHLNDSTQRQPKPYRSIGVTRHHSSPIARGFRQPGVDDPGSVGCRPPASKASQPLPTLRKPGEGWGTRKN